MVKVAVYNNETEAHLARNFLIAQDIPAEIVGSKEYTAHVLGGGAGHFELMVDPINLALARDHLGRVEKNATEPNANQKHTNERNSTETTDGLTPAAELNHFRRSAIFAFVAIIILPIIFNYTSIREALLFWRHSDQRWLAVLQMSFLMILQLVPVVYGILIYRAVYY